jgi:TatD DNase family protein
VKPVDCHCHLEFDRFDSDRAQVIERAKEKLDFVVTVGCTPLKNERTLEIAEKHPNFILPNLGLHPTYTDEFDSLEKVKRQIRNNDPCAIGEIGLDHHHVEDKELRERQRKVFRELLGLAEELDKPVNVHSREAEQEVIDILKEYDLPGGLIHCFNGSPSQAEEAVKNGFTVGITTQVLYSDGVQRIVERLDVSDLVLETDSPFLYRGGRNEPVNVVESAERIAGLKDVSKDEVVKATSENAERIFR